jgi:hypothetical protein
MLSCSRPYIKLAVEIFERVLDKATFLSFDERPTQCGDIDLPVLKKTQPGSHHLAC